MTKTLRLILTCFCGIAFLPQVSLAESSGDILQWIPQATKNLIVVNPPITYYCGNSQPIDPESMFEFIVLGRILCAPFGIYTDDVRRVKPSEVVQIANLDLRKGRKEFEYCEIALLKPDRTRDTKMLNTLREHAKSQTEYLGIPIFKLVSECCDEEKEKVEFEAIPAPGVLVCASSIERLTEVLHDNKLGTTICKTGPEWNELPLSSSYWGFCRFNDTQKTSFGDSEAVGYNFSYDKRTISFNLKVFTKSAAIEDQYLKQLLDEGASFSSSKTTLSGFKVFSYFYPATQPPGWHGPINEKVPILILGLPASVESLRSEATRTKPRTKAKRNCE